jgi:hypothetical protein
VVREVLVAVGVVHIIMQVQEEVLEQQIQAVVAEAEVIHLVLEAMDFKADQVLLSFVILDRKEERVEL